MIIEVIFMLLLRFFIKITNLSLNSYDYFVFSSQEKGGFL